MKEYKGAPFFANMTSVLNVNSDDVAEVCGAGLLGLSYGEDRELAMIFAAAPEILSVLKKIVDSGHILPHLKIESQWAIAKALGESK